MNRSQISEANVTVVVVADVESNASSVIERVLKPAGFSARPLQEAGPPADVLVVDITMLRGDPMSSLRRARESGLEAPAIVLAAHFPANRLRELFHLGVGDVLLKPYKPEELARSVDELYASRQIQSEPEVLARRLTGVREDVRQRSEEIRKLSEIGRVVASLDDLDQILRRVVEAATYLTGAEESSIYLADEHSNALELRANKQAGERMATLQKLRVNDTLVGSVYQTGQPVLQQPPSAGGSLKVQTGFLVQAMIYVPIRQRREIVGVLGVYNRFSPRAFTEHHRSLLMALADWAGVALDRAVLIQGALGNAGPQRSATVEGPAMSGDWIPILTRSIQRLEAMITMSTALEPGARQSLEHLKAQLQILLAVPVATEAGRYERRQVDLTAMVDRVVGAMRPEALQRGLELIVEQGPGLPPLDTDAERIRRVLEAVIGAAIRRTRQGRVLLQLHHFEVLNRRSEALPIPIDRGMRDGTWVAVTVADTSSGLSPDTIRALEMTQPDPRIGKLETGLSMGEVRMIAESLGGVLWHGKTPASTTVAFAIPVT